MRYSLNFKFGGRIPLFAILLMLNSCSDEFNPFNNEIDFLTNFNEIAIVNSNICVHDTTHFIRVQRGFIAEDFTDYAHNSDSLYFNPDDIEVNVYVLRVDLIEDGEIVDADTLEKYVCKDTVVSIDSIGNIGIDDPVLYYFKSSKLTQYGYQDIYLGLEVIHGDEKYYAHTKTVDGVGFALSPYGNTFPIENDYFDLSFEIPKYTSRYVVKMNCRYLEMQLTEDKLDTTLFTAEVLIADIVLKTPLTYSDSVKFTHTTELFYQGIEKQIERQGDLENTWFRKIKDVYFSSIVLNYDLLIANNEIQNDVTSFNNSVMYFSNIKNGLGYFSSYGKRRTRIYYYTSETIGQFLDSVGYKYLFRR